jgi:hypothetical protein
LRQGPGKEKTAPGTDHDAKRIFIACCVGLVKPSKVDTHVSFPTRKRTDVGGKEVSKREALARNRNPTISESKPTVRTKFHHVSPDCRNPKTQVAATSRLISNPAVFGCDVEEALFKPTTL